MLGCTLCVAHKRCFLCSVNIILWLVASVTDKNKYYSERTKHNNIVCKLPHCTHLADTESTIHLPVPLKMFADGNSLLDQVVQILRNGGSKSLLLQDSQDLISSDKAHLGDTVGITQDDTWKRRQHQQMLNVFTCS